MNTANTGYAYETLGRYRDNGHNDECSCKGEDVCTFHIIILNSLSDNVSSVVHGEQVRFQYTVLNIIGLHILSSMDLRESRTWIIFYLISFVLLLVAVFLTANGVLLGVGLTMVIVVIGVNLIFMLGQVKESSKKREMMEKVSHIERNDKKEQVNDEDLPF